jgi:hypothetical protein
MAYHEKPSPSMIKGTHGWSLNAAVTDSRSETPNKMWPTPTVNDSKNNGGKAQYNRMSNGKPRGLDLNAKIGGALNPMWVEWLMGYPIGWTDLKD